MKVSVVMYFGALLGQVNNKISLCLIWHEAELISPFVQTYYVKFNDLTRVQLI